MLRAHRIRRAAVAAVLAGGLLLPDLAISDDTVLFSTVVPPNVMLQVDNSGSMHHVVWHPAYDPTVIPTCTFFTDLGQYFVNTGSGDTNGPSSAGDTTFAPGTFSLPSPPAGCVSSALEIYVDPVVQANGAGTRWDGRYLNWYYSAAAAPFVAQIVATNNGTASSCLGGGSYDLYRRSRISAAQQILRDVICQVNAAGAVRFGLAQFRRGGDPNGGYVTVPIDDYFDSSGNPVVYTLNGISQSHGAHLDDAIADLTGEANTPVAETLFQVYTYFMSRVTSERPFGADNSTRFPQYQYTTSTTSGSGGPQSSSGAPTVPGPPVQHECQKNFVIVITDGEPTRDDFDTETPTNTAVGFSSFDALIGDFHQPVGDEPNERVDPPTCAGCEGSLFLDDIAKFMQVTDFRPDLPPHNGQEQVIDVYTVGFTTSAYANALLQKTATAGNGQFYHSNDPQKLAADIIAAVNDIIAKAQAFTAATVPAVRTAQGGKFYTSLFVPSRLDGFWEGHLESWNITIDGEIHDKFGNCALADPNAPAQCHEGPFLSTAQPFWNAGQVLSASTPSSRNLITTRITGPGTSSMVAFDTATMMAADLGVTAADIPSYPTAPNPAPTTAEELADVIVDNVRGCQLGAVGGGCTKRSWLLGDIFHSSPVVVPGPQSFLNDQSYKAFETNYATRQRMIIAGANDGFLHLFDAGTWQAGATPPDYDDGTGAEVAGFMPYTARQNVKQLPIDKNGRTAYFVDGSPTVSDVWLYTNPRLNSPKDGSDWQRWRTVILGGLREGGNQIYALDITNPGGSCASPATGSGYPCYLWEFPREDAPTGPGTIKSYMGQTWSEPIIAKVKVDPDGNYLTGYDRWVAIFAGGYDPSGDPNDTLNYDATATAGRAIFMVDIATGQVLGMKAFDPSATAAPGTDPTTVPFDPLNPERSMHYAIASTPAVMDIDFDGYADLVVVGDLGGNVWKWVISPIGDDPITLGGGGTVAQTRWPFVKFFSAPTYHDGTRRYWKSIYFAPSATFKNRVLWYAFGTGERSDLQFLGVPATGEENRFYSMTDLDPYEISGTTAPLDEALDLVDLTSGSGSACPALTKRGFYLVGADGEKFITQSDIFFYYVFVASYIPTISANPCVSTGNSFLYSFKVYCGEGLFDTNSDGTSENAISLGSGMPTDPKITISSGSGSSGSPSPNRIIVNKQDGELETEDAPPGFGAGIGQFYWREM